MVKFKMKIWLALAIIGFMSFSMLFYVSIVNDLKTDGFYVICLSRHQCRDINFNNVITHGEKNPKRAVAIFKALGNVSNKDRSSINDAKIISIPINTNLRLGIANDTRYLFSEFEKDFQEKAARNNRILKLAEFSSTISLDSPSYVHLQSINRSVFNLLDVNSVDERFRKRKALAIKQCSQAYNTTTLITVEKEKLEHILVDEKNKALFCYIPKVACTNWKRMLLLIMGKSKNETYVNNIPSYEIHAKNLFKSLQNYSVTQIEFFLGSYTKFIFVRNPLERLLSAYRNKLEQHYNSSKYFQMRFGKYIVKNFRVNPSNVSLAKGNDVTFSEFVSYLVSTERKDYNEHWQTMTDLCFPCFVNYDYIGKYEHLVEDSKYFINKLGMNYTFPTLVKPSQTASTMKGYFSQLSSKLITELYKIYEMDFRLFGYSLENTLGF